jgi:hypothetical protein
MNMRLVRHFANSDFRCRHDGFAAIASEFEIDAKNLPIGKFLLFTNAALTKAAVFGPNNVLLFIEHPEKRRIDLSIIPEIPLLFSGKKFDYDRAMSKILEKKLKLKKAA